MAIFEYPEIFLFALTLILLCIWRSKTSKNSSLPTNWPLSHRIQAYTTEILTETGGTFDFKFPWYLNMDMLFTCDPANIHHIFSRNFPNYPKGPKFRKIFEILGNGIFNVDFEMWEFHRKTTLSILTHFEFYGLLERSVWQTVENGLLPVLDYFSKQGTDFDLQDIFQRFTFDSICKVVLDFDPRSLCVEMPYVKCEKAFNDVIEALLYRHLLPESVCKLQKWLGIGKEKKLVEAWKAFDEFIYPLVDHPNEMDPKTDDFNLLASFRKAHEDNNGTLSDESRDFLRDTALNLMFAGRDTTSTCLTWLFWLIATNPSTEIKILEEIETQLNLKEEDNKNWRFFNVNESKKLIYLHGALCESLRLFPPVALEHKAPTRPDHLPSGNYIDENTKVIISFYSVGRMEKVWGKDCLQFRPERWISPSGGIKHEPSYKFPAFNVGPRACLGKEMAFIQMKMVAATILYRYNVRLVEGQVVSPRDSIITQARNGLTVRLSKRIV
ncbi:alkane hydroxylase mah1 [Phtheirospermum japonicum]|uniref:Alkane hydroxylase mah1 n=1 Tax=Phtheirospermum japonicum TaxID=374723 RepID=A0A830CL27_9LAMI|nr:alkane hydroxylase mah1 [Phtheirospermum japonicum]